MLIKYINSNSIFKAIGKIKEFNNAQKRTKKIKIGERDFKYCDQKKFDSIVA